MTDLNHLYPIQLVDIYSDNRWNAVEEKSKGARGVLIKAGQGGLASLPIAFVIECLAVGLPYGVYWVIDSRYDSSYHMGAIKSTFPDMRFGKLGMWWDCEKPQVSMTDVNYWKTKYPGNRLIETVTDKFFTWCGETGGIYTSPGFAALLGWDTITFKEKPLADKLARMPLWVAQYNNAITEPDLFGKWADWVLWQYRPDPDYNYFNGGEEAFQLFLEGELSPLPPSTTGEKMKATLKSGFIANVKPMAGSAAIVIMDAENYVFGEFSITKSDIINFNHFYRKGGVRVNLSTMSKVNAANMIIDLNAVDDGLPPTDPPPPAQVDDINVVVNKSAGVITVTVDGEVFRQ